MKMLAVLPLFIVALCVMECRVSAVPLIEPEQYLELLEEREKSRNKTFPTNEPEQDLEPTNEPQNNLELLEERGKNKNKNKGGEVWTQFGAYSYLVSGQVKSQPDAKQFCSDRGADLVKINSAEENEFVLQLVRQKAPALKEAWIGLTWDSNAKDWTWNDNSVPVYTNWGPDEPNGNADEPCAEMYTNNGSDFPINGYWNDIPCNLSNGIVCKKLA